MSDTDDALRGQVIAHEMAIKYLLATLLKHQDNAAIGAFE